MNLLSIDAVSSVTYFRIRYPLGHFGLTPIIFFVVFPLIQVIVARGLAEGEDEICEGVFDGDGLGDAVRKGEAEGVGVGETYAIG